MPVSNTTNGGLKLVIILFSQRKVSPFATWVMSHVLSDVMSCHSYNLRIIRHLQEPCQDPIEGRKTKGDAFKSRALSALKKRGHIGPDVSQILVDKNCSETAS